LIISFGGEGNGSVVPVALLLLATCPAISSNGDVANLVYPPSYSIDPVLTGDYASGTVASWSCASNYVISGDTTSWTCQPTGVWSSNTYPTCAGEPDLIIWLLRVCGVRLSPSSELFRRWEIFESETLIVVSVRAVEEISIVSLLSLSRVNAEFQASSFLLYVRCMNLYADGEARRLGHRF
jgi:sushi repeat-containing protein (SCR repeat)